jgi:hypothetical protein
MREGPWHKLVSTVSKYGDKSIRLSTSFESDFGYDHLFREVTWELAIRLCEIATSDTFWWMHTRITAGKVDCARSKDAE